MKDESAYTLHSDQTSRQAVRTEKRYKQQLAAQQQRAMLLLGLLSFILFPLIAASCLLVLGLGGDRHGFKISTFVATATLASLANFWRKRYKISLSQAAKAVTFGSTASLICLLAIWILLSTNAE